MLTELKAAYKVLSKKLSFFLLNFFKYFYLIIELHFNREGRGTLTLFPSHPFSTNYTADVLNLRIKSFQFKNKYFFPTLV